VAWLRNETKNKKTRKRQQQTLEKFSLCKKIVWPFSLPNFRVGKNPCVVGHLFQLIQMRHFERPEKRVEHKWHSKSLANCLCVSIINGALLMAKHGAAAGPLGARKRAKESLCLSIL
jgi:hypothetical protein